MGRYRVKQKTDIIIGSKTNYFIVKADSPEEAREAVENGEGDLLYSETDVSESETKDITVEEEI